MAHLDALLMPSLHEGLPYTLLEAMSLGLPVAASRVGGLPEVIEHGVSGYLHPPEEVGAMAESGLAILTDPGLHARVAAAARRVVHDRFCAEKIVPRYERFYEEVLAG